MRKTLATIALAGLLGGCAVTREQQTVGQYIDDSTITTQVKAKFADDSAVAATAIARRIGLPRQIVTVLEGESLLDDATALVALSGPILLAEWKIP